MEAQDPTIPESATAEVVPRALRTPRSPQAVNYLFVALCPLVFWMLRGDIGSLIAGIFLLGLYAIAAHLILIALEDEEMGIPYGGRLLRKLVGSTLIGVATALLALVQMVAPLMSLGLGCLAFALSIVAFGVDQNVTLRVRLRKDTPKDLRKLIGTAERVLAAIPEQAAQVDDEPVLLQAQAFQATVLDMVERYHDVLDQVTAEFRHVLTEAAEATDAFVLEYLDDPDPRIRRRYMILLKELAEALEQCLQEAALPEPAAVSFDEDEELFIKMGRKQAA